MLSRSALCVLILFLMISSACTPGLSISEYEEPLISPTELEQPLSLESPTPSKTLTSIPTIAPTVTATEAPMGLNPSGPYLYFETLAGVWIANPDGSYPSQISALYMWNDLDSAISPDGKHLAILAEGDSGLELWLVSIPSGQAERIAMLSAKLPPGDDTSPQAMASDAIRGYSSPTWQPGEGRYLAFAAAINGITSDLYLYDVQTKTITQLTDGPSQAIHPSWSPDGAYILHAGVSYNAPFGGAIGYSRLDGVWSVRLADEKVISLPKPNSLLPNFVGWLDERHYITYDLDEEYCGVNLRSVDVETGSETILMPYAFMQGPSYVPGSRAVVFSGQDSCAGSQGDGIYMLQVDGGEVRKIWNKKAWDLVWMRGSDMIYAYPEGLISGDGNRISLPPVYESSFSAVVSKAGYEAWKVIQNQQPSILVRASGGDWQVVSREAVDAMIWDPLVGETLVLVRPDGRLHAASAPGFELRSLGRVGEKTIQVSWHE